MQEEVDWRLQDHSGPCPAGCHFKEELLSIGLEYLCQHNFEGEGGHPEQILHPVVGLHRRDGRDDAQKGHTSRQEEKEGRAYRCELSILEEVLHDKRKSKVVHCEKPQGNEHLCSLAKRDGVLVEDIRHDGDHETSDGHPDGSLQED